MHDLDTSKKWVNGIKTVKFNQNWLKNPKKLKWSFDPIFWTQNEF